MNEETVVAVFTSASQAEAAVGDLKAANVPSGAISVHGPQAAGAASGTSGREPGFWSNLFGGHPDHDTAIYQRSIENGSTIVTVLAPLEHVETVARILETHGPVDLDDGATGSLATGTTTTTQVSPALQQVSQRAVATPAAVGTGEEAIALSEEQIAVGKRLVNRGSTRVRRFVVETPVEQNVTLHSEHVTIDRRPAAAGATVGGDAFKDSVVEVSESDEEVVVGKTARVVEEVVVRKDATDRVETVRDTVRREDVEITKDGGTTTTTGSTIGAAPLTGSKI